MLQQATPRSPTRSEPHPLHRRNLCQAVLLLLLGASLPAQQEKPTPTRLQLLTPDGGVLRDSIAYIRTSSPGRSSSFSKRLDPDGGLRLDLADRDGTTVHVEVVEQFGKGHLAGTLTLATDAAGKWRMDRDGRRLIAPIIGLAGRVHAPDGSAVAGIVIAVHPNRPYRATTDADGRFRIWMPAQPPARQYLDLKLRSEGCYFDRTIDQPLPVRYGDREAKIVVRRAAHMHFAADGLPADTVLAHGCRLSCESATTGAPGAALNRFRLSGDRILLPDGLWNLVFRRGQDEVYRIDNVLAVGGTEIHDPRLTQFDWRRLGNLVTVRVQDKLGRPTEACRITWIRASSTTKLRHRRGVVRLLLQPKGAHLRVEPGPGGPIDLGVVTSDQVVRLR